MGRHPPKAGTFGSRVTASNGGTGGSDHAILEARVHTTTSGDPKVYLTIGDGAGGITRRVVIGLDNSDSDLIKLSGDAGGDPNVTTLVTVHPTTGDVGIGVTPSLGALHIRRTTACVAAVETTTATSYAELLLKVSTSLIGGIDAYGATSAGTEALRPGVLLMFGIQTAGLSYVAEHASGTQRWYCGGYGAANEAMRLGTDKKLTCQFGLILADAKDIEINATTGSKIGQAGSKIGLYGATPVVQGAAVADATDAATAITQLNALLARMRSLGAIAT